MQKLYLAVILLAAGFSAVKAQTPVLGDNDQPIKLADVVKQYKQAHSEPVIEKNGKVEEGENYHFDRWLWYWERHTDHNGYMVSSVQNFKEAIYSGRAVSKTTADQSDWKFVGPTSSPSGYNGIGRINNIEFHPTNPNEYWVATAGGGAWKTVNDGVSWTNMTNDLAVLGVSDIDINPLNPNTIYLCPGDRDGSDTYSTGVLKSTDGGQTWDSTGLIWTRNQFRLTNCLVINPQDTNSLTLAASNGIYKSFDGGQNWTSVQSGHFKQVLYHPTDTNILYAPRYNNNRQIYRSTDGGMNWTVVSNFNNARRIELAVTPQSPNLLKAVVCNSANGLMGIYHSSDTGVSYTQLYAPSGSNCNGNLITGNLSGNGCGRQGYYDLTIVINPTDSTEVYVGGVNTYASNNGGQTWSLVTQWYSGLGGVATVHADKHMHKFHPLVPGRLFECNDGGVYKTDAPQSQLWTDVSNGLGITQFYRNAVTNAANYALGGSQDNGTKGWQANQWSELTGGDGMECQADPIDSNVFYTAIQRGELRRTLNGGFSYQDISNNIPSNPQGAWITPYIISPSNNMHLVAGYKHIYFSPDRGNNWYSIQGSEITGGNAERVAMTADTPATIYALFPDSNDVVFYTDSFIAGQNATFDTIQIPVLYQGNVSDIKAHPTDSGRFWLSYSGYNSPQFVEYDKGTWTRINTGLPDVPINCIEFDSSRNVLYVGTDIAVYYNDTSTQGQWEPYRKNMPNIEITDLGINYNTKEIWASTYGRGMWNSVLQGSVVVPDPPDTTDSPDVVIIIPYVEDVFVIAPNPNRGDFKIVAGKHITADEPTQISIVDYTGKVIYRKETILEAGNATDIGVEEVPAGVYIVELSNSKAVLGRKRVVIR